MAQKMSACARWARRFFPILFAKFQDLELVETTYYYDDDGNQEVHNHTHAIDALYDIHSYSVRCPHDKSDSIKLENIVDTETLCKAIAYTSFDEARVLTKEAWAKERSEEQRKKLEYHAKNFALRKNVSVNSFAFLDACDSELNRLSNYREGMREDGLCIGYGVTLSQWYDELNESECDSSHISEIMGWIEENIPLMYMKWNAEKEAKEEQNIY